MYETSSANLIYLYSVLSDVYRPKASTALFQSTTSHNLDSSLLWQMMLCTLLRGVGLETPVTVSVFVASIPVRTDVFYFLNIIFINLYN